MDCVKCDTFDETYFWWTMFFAMFYVFIMSCLLGWCNWSNLDVSVFVIGPFNYRCSGDNGQHWSCRPEHLYSQSWPRLFHSLIAQPWQQARIVKQSIFGPNNAQSIYVWNILLEWFGETVDVLIFLSSVYLFICMFLYGFNSSCAYTRYDMRIRSISWLLMSWLLSLISGPLSSMRKYFNYLCHLIVMKS